MNQLQALNRIQLLLQKGKNKEAENISRQLLSKFPNNGHAHLFLAMSIKDGSRFELKKKEFSNAERILKDDGNALLNIGNYYLEIGNFEESIKCYEKAIYLTKNENYYLNLADAHRFSGNLNEQIIYYEKVKSKQELNGLIACVWLCIIYYILGDLGKMSGFLIESKSIMLLNDKKSEPYRIYWNYMAMLLRWHSSNTLKNKSFNKVHGLIHVIGESHSLTTHGLHVEYKNTIYQCIAHWVAGCKQHHFSSNYNDNKFKNAVIKVVKGLKDNEIIMFSIGEIDCRENSGILNYVNKNKGKNIDEVINKTIGDYFNFLKSICKNNLVIISGVPASNLKQYPANFSPLNENNIIYLIKKFNEVLKIKCKEYEFEFLDIYSLTVDQNSLANGKFHIDDYHLVPSAIQTAFSDYLQSPF